MTAAARSSSSRANRCRRATAKTPTGGSSAPARRQRHPSPTPDGGVSGRNTGGHVMAQRASRSLSRGCEDISPFPALSGCGSPAQPVRCCFPVGPLRRSVAAVVSGAMQGGTRNVVPLPAAHDFDSDRRAPGAPYGGVLAACRCPWPTSPPPTRRPSPRPQAPAAPWERFNVRAGPLTGANLAAERQDQPPLAGNSQASSGRAAHPDSREGGPPSRLPRAGASPSEGGGHFLSLLFEEAPAAGAPRGRTRIAPSRRI